MDCAVRRWPPALRRRSARCEPQSHPPSRPCWTTHQRVPLAYCGPPDVPTCPQCVQFPLDHKRTLLNGRSRYHTTASTFPLVAGPAS